MMVAQHSPYPHILDYLASRWSDAPLPELLEYLAPFGYEFWETLQTAPETADYTTPENQAYYLLRIFPHHIEQLYHTLSEVPPQAIELAFRQKSIRACFFGAGPAPEVIGWLMYLGQHAPHVETAHATVLDKYTETWQDIQHNLTLARLAPAYWQQGTLTLESHTFDNQTPLDWRQLDPSIQSAIGTANLLVFQNCLSDLTDPDQFIANFCELLKNVPADSLIVFNDLKYDRVRGLLESLELSAHTNGIKKEFVSWKDGLVIYRSQIVSPDVIRQHYWAELKKKGLSERIQTKYYRQVFLTGVGEFKSLTMPDLPIMRLAGGILANPVLTAHPHMPEMLEVLLAPGRQLRLSPYIQGTQSKYLFGEMVGAGSREQDWKRLKDRHQKDFEQWAKEWRTHIRQGGTGRSDLYTGSEMLRRAALIVHASWHIPQTQRILLDLLQQGDLPAELSVLICSEAPSLELMALLDFLIALQDVCDLLSADYTVPTLRVLCLSPNDLEFDQTHISNYLEQVEPVYDERLPVATFIWRRVSAEHWLETLSGQTHFTLTFISNHFTQGISSDLLEALFTHHLANSVVVLSEASGDSATQLFQWRHNFIKQYPRFRALAPCGEEFGNNLPQVCLSCAHSPIRRKEPLHAPSFYTEFVEYLKALSDTERLAKVPDEWSYAVLYGGNNTNTVQDLPTITFDDKVDIENLLSVRYLGTFTAAQGGVATYHPDSAFTQNVGGPQEEHYRVCPGHSNAQKLSICRKPGKHIPLLRFGQQLKLKDCSVERIRNSHDFRIMLKETTYYETDPSATRARTFLPQYSSDTESAVDRIAHRLFGFAQMRPFQHAILRESLTGKSVLGIASTGGGKSECYILPAMLLPGITVVISPLKSLMQDQYDQRLRDRYGLDYVSTFINSDVSTKERQARLHRMEHGYYKLVYLTPEQLQRSYTLESLKRADKSIGVRYIALDEAHCISQWGHDFRPSYLNIVERLERYDIHPVRIALTATASPKVREDLCRELHLTPGSPAQGGNVLIFSSNRTELNLIVKTCRTTDEKVNTIVDLLKRFQQRQGETGAAIVFMPHAGWMPDHKADENKYSNGKANPNDHKQNNQGWLSAGATGFASYLEHQLEQQVSLYHGKMEDDDETELDEEGKTVSKDWGDLSGRNRRTEQKRFIQGETNIMVATKGFGMGIDKPNIRLIIHRTPTSNLEAYAQEAGRAGRDGKRADVVLFYSSDAPQQGKSDHEIQTWFIDNNYIRPEDAKTFYEYLKTLKPDGEGRVYFESTSIIEFFDQRARYEWKPLPEVQRFGKWSHEHLELKERGEAYQEKIRHIERILAALYRVRPDIPDMGERIAFLEGVQSVRIYPHTMVINGHAILTSNQYFGAKFRAAGLNAIDLEKLLREPTLVPFAQRMGISLVEASEIFNDIKYAEGNWNGGGKWQGTLLNGWLKGPPYRMDWRDWREKAGVSRRAKLPEGKDKRSATLDDWFPESTLVKPIGWEVTVGQGFDARYADAVLEAFITLHEERKQNDWASYHRLLTEYVGAELDGSLNGRKAKPVCLRSVMLGYLKTYEVVVGGNCKSCGTCVPNLDFEQYSDEERRAVVISMEEETQTLIDQFEGLADAAPSEGDLDRLFKRIEYEEGQMRSVRNYVSAWSARLLQDTPNHRGGLWARTAGVLAAHFNIDSGELRHNLEQLIAYTTDANELQRISLLVDELTRNEHLEDSLRNWLQALIAERRGDFVRAVELYSQVIQAAHASDVVESALKAHLKLCAPEGHVPHQGYYRNAAFELAIPLDKETELQDLYHNYCDGLAWEEMLDSSRDSRLDQTHRSVLCWAWFEQHTVTDVILEAADQEFPNLWRWVGRRRKTQLRRLAEGELPLSPVGRRAAAELALLSDDFQEMVGFYAAANQDVAWENLQLQASDHELDEAHHYALGWSWALQQTNSDGLLTAIDEVFPKLWNWLGQHHKTHLIELSEGDIVASSLRMRAVLELATLSDDFEEMVQLYTIANQDKTWEDILEQAGNPDLNDVHRYAVRWSWVLQHTDSDSLIPVVDETIPDLWNWLRTEQKAYLNQFTEGPSAHTPLGMRAALELATVGEEFSETLRFYQIANQDRSGEQILTQAYSSDLDDLHRYALVWSVLVQQEVTTELLATVQAALPTIWVWMGSEQPTRYLQFLGEIAPAVVLEVHGLLTTFARSLQASESHFRGFVTRLHSWVIESSTPAANLLRLNNAWDEFLRELSPLLAVELVECLGIETILTDKQIFSLLIKQWSSNPLLRGLTQSVAGHLAEQPDIPLLPNERRSLVGSGMSTSSLKGLASELVLHATQFYGAVIQNPAYITNNVFNRPDASVHIAKPMDIRHAHSLMPHFQPVTIAGLASWFAYFPATSTSVEDARYGLDLLIKAENVLQQDDGDKSSIWQLLRGVYDTVQADEALAQEAYSVWERMITAPEEQVLHTAQGIIRGWVPPEDLQDHILAMNSPKTLTEGFTRLMPFVESIPMYQPFLRFGNIMLTLQEHIKGGWNKDGSTIHRIFESFSPETSVEGAHQAAIVLTLIQKALKNPNWLTPLKYLIQAHALAGDFEDAQSWSDQDDRLVFSGNRSAKAYIDSVRSKLKGKHADHALDPVLQHGAKLWVRLS